MGFDAAWDPVAHMYPELAEFCRGIGTVMPTTTAVESDFSLLKLAHSPSRSSWTKFGIQRHLINRDLPTVARLVEFPVQFDYVVEGGL
jgi:hypothetical protein